MANHAKAWDAKLLAYVLPRQNTVAGLPGGFTSAIMSSGTASATNAVVLLEDDTMLNYLLTATMLAVLAFAPMSLAQTADGMTPAEEPVCDELSGALYGLCVAYCEAIDCHLSDQLASDEACERVLTNYMSHSDGDMPPCHDPVEGSEDEGSGDTGETGEGGQEEAPQA